MGISIHSARLDANHPPYPDFDEQRRSAVCALIKQHGFDPMRVVSIEYACYDLPMLTMEQVTADLEVTADGMDFVRLRQDVALKTHLPAWWQPSCDGNAS